MPRSDQTSFLIEVLEGPNAGALELFGREMPLRDDFGGGLSYGVEQRVQETWVPGSRTGQLQVIGPKILPTTVAGEWKDRYLGVDRAISLAERFEEICEQGCAVRVSWQTRTNVGLLTKFVWRPGVPDGGVDSIAWEATFTWTSKGPRGNTALVSTGRQGPISDEARQAAQSVTEVVAAMVSFGLDYQIAGIVGGPRFNLDDAQATLAATVSAQNSAAEYLDLANEAPPGPVTAALAQAKSAELALSDVGRQFGNLFHAVASVDDSVSGVAAATLGRYAVVEESIQSLKAQDELATRLEALLRPEAFARVVPVEGMDLRRLSVRFYGDPDFWPRIAKRNGLTDSKIPAGISEIIVPLSLPDPTSDRVGGDRR